MSPNRYIPEQIIGMLREAEVLLSRFPVQLSSR